MEVKESKDREDRLGSVDNQVNQDKQVIREIMVPLGFLEKLVPQEHKVKKELKEN